MKNRKPYVFLSLVLCAILLSSCAGTTTITNTVSSPEEPGVQTGETASAVSDEPTLSDDQTESPSESIITPTPSSTETEPSTQETEPAKEPEMEKLNVNFSENDVTASAYHTSVKEGKFAQHARWVSTGYLDVDGVYAYAYVLAGHKLLCSISYFDEGKNYISGVGTTSTSGCATLRGVSVVPENAKYVRFINFVDGGYPVAFADTEILKIASEEDYGQYKKAHPYIDRKIVCIGDSLTEGDYGLVVGAACVHYKNYPWFLERFLDCQTVNFGRCGITVDGYMTFYSNVDLSDADVVLVMLGTNAGIHGKSTEKNYSNLIKMIKRDMKEDCELVIVTPPHATEVRSKPNYGYNDNVYSAVEYERSIAKSLGITLIDAYENSPIKPENESVYQPNDGLHMAEKGYEAFARFIADELISLGIWKN